jgi:hypothetical protein
VTRSSSTVRDRRPRLDDETGSATEVMSNQAAPPAPGRADPQQAAPPVPPGGGPSRAVGGLDDIIGEAAGAIPSDFNPLLEPQPQAPVRPTAADLQGRPIIHDAIEIAVPAQRPAPRPTPAPPGAIPTNWDADDSGEPYVETASGLQPTAPPPVRLARDRLRHRPHARLGQRRGRVQRGLRCAAARRRHAARRRCLPRSCRSLARPCAS